MSELQQLLQGLNNLVQAMDRHTKSNQELTQALIDAMSDEDGDQDEPRTYMDGTPCP